MRIEIPGDEKMKKHVNYLLAASVFILMLILLYGSSVILAAVVAVAGPCRRLRDMSVADTVNTQ